MRNVLSPAEKHADPDIHPRKERQRVRRRSDVKHHQQRNGNVTDYSEISA